MSQPWFGVVGQCLDAQSGFAGLCSGCNDRCRNCCKRQWRFDRQRAPQEVKPQFPPEKQTTLGLYVTASEAYERRPQRPRGQLSNIPIGLVYLAVEPKGIPSVFLANPRPRDYRQPAFLLIPFNTLLTQTLLTPA